MSMQEFIDMLHELLVVDTEEGLVKYTKVESDRIHVQISDGKKFTVIVEKS